MRVGTVCTGKNCEERETCLHYEDDPTPYQAKVDPDDILVEGVCKDYKECS